MSTEIGNLIHFEAGEKPEYFKGRLDLPELYGECFLVPNGGERTENAPDFILKVNIRGRAYKRGAAWRKEAEKTGEEYYSMVIDGPELRNEVRCSAFLLSPENQPNEESPDHWRIVWGRARSSSSSVGRGQDLGNDAIPY